MKQRSQQRSLPGKLASQKQMVEHIRWFSRRFWSQHSRKTKESLKSVMRLCQPETSFFEPTVSVRTNMCSDELLSWLLNVLVPGAGVAVVTMPVLDRTSERATQIRQAARQAFEESQDDKAMRRALVVRPRPWREFQVGEQVAFWRRGKGRGMRHGHARWHGRAVVLALCSGSKNVWVAHRRQLLGVCQEQLRMATIKERVADDVINQELRAIGENSATDGQVLPKYLDISKDPLPPSAEEFTQESPE